MNMITWQLYQGTFYILTLPIRVAIIPGFVPLLRIFLTAMNDLVAFRYAAHVEIASHSSDGVQSFAPCQLLNGTDGTTFHRN